MSGTNGEAEKVRRNAKGTGPTGAESNTLKAPQMYTLTRWLDDKRDYIHNSGKDRDVIVAEITEAVGFPVTVWNMRTACGTLGIEMPKPPKRASGFTRGAAKMREAFGVRLDKIEADVRAAGELVCSVDHKGGELATIVGRLAIAIDGLRKDHNTMGAALSGLVDRVNELDRRDRTRFPALNGGLGNRPRV